MTTLNDRIEAYIRQEIVPLPNVDLVIEFPDDNRIVIKLVSNGSGRGIEVSMAEMLTEYELFKHLSIACKKLTGEYVAPIPQRI